LGCQLRRPVGRPGHVGRAGAVVGVDAGVRALAVLSRPVPGLTDAEGKVPNPRRLARVAGRLRRQQRRVARRVGPDDPAARSRRRPSRRQQQARRRLARLHGQVRDARADGWHKLTTALAQRFDTVVVEDLNVAGMLARPAPKPDRRGRWARNGTAAKTGLARSVADAAPAQLRRLLAYKTAWYSSRLHVASRFYPSSKTCSACGLALDRDRNAGRNLARLVGHGTGSAPETGARDGSNARGDPVSPAPPPRDGHGSAKREARTATVGKTQPSAARPQRTKQRHPNHPTR
jgi:putative transposase